MCAQTSGSFKADLTPRFLLNHCLTPYDTAVGEIWALIWNCNLQLPSHAVSRGLAIVRFVKGLRESNGQPALPCQIKNMTPAQG